MVVPPKIDAVESAVRYRRLQLAQALLSSWGTRVRHGPFMGLDLGPQVLQREQPVARALGLSHAALLQHVLPLCRRQTQLLHLGAVDGFLAAGLLQAQLVATAQLLPASDTAGDLVREDIARLGLTDRMHLLPPKAEAPLPSAAPDRADASHWLCVAESARWLADWLADCSAESPTDALQHTSCLWPAEPDGDSGALEQLRRHLGSDISWQCLEAADGAAAPAELAGLDATDRALLTSDTGPQRWWLVHGGQVVPRRRTLLCTEASDLFVSRLLMTLRWDAHEPLALDVLLYGLSEGASLKALPSLARFPCGVRVFQVWTEAGNEGIHPIADAFPVRDSDGRPVAIAASFFDDYEQFAVWSINRHNAGLLQWLSARHGRERLLLLVSDDEVDLRYRVQQFLHTGDTGLQAAARQRFPAGMEAAFNAVRHFWVARQPWEEMLRYQRQADLVVHPCLLPIENNLSGAHGVQPPEGCYVLMLHSKPSLPRQEVLAQLNALLHRWQVDRPLRVVLIRNDMASTPMALPNGYGQAELRVYPYPLPESMYFGLMAGCHGMVLVPRGGMTSTRDAIRLGLDIFDDGSEFSPNRMTLRDEMGLHLNGPAPITVLHGGHVNTPAQREGNQRRLAAYEHDAVSRLRHALL